MKTRNVSVILLLMLCVGCGTIARQPPSRSVYGGVRKDVEWIAGGGVAAVLDVPFSLVFDTIFLPFDLYYVIKPIPDDFVKGWKCHDAAFEPPNLKNFRNYPNSWYYRPDQIYQVDQTVLDDYQKFVEELKSKNPRYYITKVFFYEDGTGQHAVKLVVNTDLREYVDYLLMYNKSNVRIRVVKGHRWHQFHI